MPKPIIFLAFANDRVDYTRYLRNLPIEQRQIREALENAQQAGLCQIVERNNASLDDILGIFQKYQDQIAVFHYGGHADGYQLLLESATGEHSVAHGGGLVSFLSKQKGLKLIFLNGCSTQQQSLELVQSGIPIVIGTSNSIDDQVATSLSVRFYRGLAKGLSLERTWNEALDALKMEKGNELKLLYRNKKENADTFPWNWYIREGSEIVKQWNLPDEVKNPLFGLPTPILSNLPERPYRFLERYKKQDSEIFFGRSFYIRELYNRMTDPNAAPVLLLYGQSGAGKSSLLDAGLLPRLEQVCQVIYLRRNQSLGLLGTLKTAFETSKNNTENSEKQQNVLKYLQEAMQNAEGYLKNQIRQVIQQFQNQENETNDELKKQWLATEQQTQRPFVILLDQAEEVFTRPMLAQIDEWKEFLGELHHIFDNPNTRPKGKLIVSYRKEFHPEIKEFFVHSAIPREEVFLQHLDRNDIIEVVEGLSKNQKLQRKYTLKVEENLAEEIADDLIASSTTSIAPVLQITLTKLWNMVEKQEERLFSIQNYRKLKSEGIFMGDFFDQQMQKFTQRYAELEQTGLALDILNYHTTDLGTATIHNLEDVRQRYGENEEKIHQIEALIQEFTNLYLLVENQQDVVGLAHDTLAPVVQQRYKNSDKAGQRAAIILENKLLAYEQNPEIYLDLDDLQVVENGKQGMRLWTNTEKALIEKSQERRTKLKRQKKFLRVAASIAIMLIITAAGLATWQWQEAEKSKEKAIKSQEEAKLQAQKAEKSLQEVRRKEVKELLQRIEVLRTANENITPLSQEIRKLIQELPQKDSLEKVLIEKIK